MPTAAHLTPFRLCLVFGPEVNNIDVVAHECALSEVYFRIGWLNHFLNIPIWFNERVALLVDHRKPYFIGSIELSKERVYAVKSKEVFFLMAKM